MDIAAVRAILSEARGSADSVWQDGVFAVLMVLEQAVASIQLLVSRLVRLVVMRRLV